MRCRIIQDSAEMRTLDGIRETLGDLNTQLSSTEEKPPSLPHHTASVDGKDLQRGKRGVRKSKENFKVSTKVSMLKPKSGFRSFLTPLRHCTPRATPPSGFRDITLPATLSLVWPPFLLTLLQKLGLPVGSSWASAQGGHTHSRLPINFTYPLTPGGNIYLPNTPCR